MAVVEDSSGDPFATWCHFHNQDPDNPEAFENYVKETTGWDGREFSLTEGERWWIMRANEVIEWLRLYSPSGEQIYLDSALRTLAGMGDIPRSLRAE